MDYRHSMDIFLGYIIALYNKKSKAMLCKKLIDSYFLKINLKHN